MGNWNSRTPGGYRDWKTQENNCDSIAEIVLALLIVALGGPGETVEACISRMKTAHHLRRERRDGSSRVECSTQIRTLSRSNIVGLIHEVITENS